MNLSLYRSLIKLYGLLVYLPISPIRGQKRYLNRSDTFVMMVFDPCGMILQ